MRSETLERAQISIIQLKCLVFLSQSNEMISFRLHSVCKSIRVAFFFAESQRWSSATPLTVANYYHYHSAFNGMKLKYYFVSDTTRCTDGGAIFIAFVNQNVNFFLCDSHRIRVLHSFQTMFNSDAVRYGPIVSQRLTIVNSSFLVSLNRSHHVHGKLHKLYVSL